MIDQDVISETMTADPRDSRVMGVLDSGSWTGCRRPVRWR